MRRESTGRASVTRLAPISKPAFAVTNAIRHANASNVSIRQRYRGGNVVIEVSDNGCGITLSPKNRRDAYGIIGMLERAKVLGASVQVRGGRQGRTPPVRSRAELENDRTNAI